MKIRHVNRYFERVLTLALLLMGTSSCVTKSTTAEAEAKAHLNQEKVLHDAAATDSESYSVIEIKYDKGSSELSDSAKKSLQSMIETSVVDTAKDEVLVLSWSDQEYPSKKIKVLPKQAKELAEQRNKVISDYVKSLRTVTIDSYNMAERPNAFSKWFNTNDAKLKNTLIAAGLPTTAKSSDYKGKASHSVILVKVNQ